MEQVTGIGAIFIHARDPEALMQWYEQHLGWVRIFCRDWLTWEVGDLAGGGDAPARMPDGPQR